MPEKTELRIEIDMDALRILDGYVHATGKSRTDVVRSLILEWAERKLHEAIVICRVAGVNPASPDADRRRTA
ncbi:MAG: hypothetical protein N2690_07170 [Rhodocyclaceae bacterium]|nr:hypothetical protein [Rhodocyclaceae bacterium]